MKVKLPRCLGRKKCRGFFSKIVFSTCRHPYPLEADKRYENSARQSIDGLLETSPINNSKYFHQLDLPENT